jgi:hypothetical protein
MRSTHIQHRRTDAYGLVAVGYLGNTVLPARGGEVFRIFLLSERSTALKREVLGSIVAERLLDATALVFAALSLSGVARASAGRWLAVAAMVGVIVLIAVGFGCLRLRAAGPAARIRQPCASRSKGFETAPETDRALPQRRDHPRVVERGARVLALRFRRLMFDERARGAVRDGAREPLGARSGGTGLCRNARRCRAVRAACAARNRRQTPSDA